MTTAHPELSAIRDLRLLRIGLATFQPAAGVIALLSSTASFSHTVTSDPGEARWPYGIGFVLGAVLIAIWGLARKRRVWLVVLSILSALLAAGMIMVTVLTARAARFDPHLGLWDDTWLGAAAVIIWLLVAAAALVEGRLIRPKSENRPPAWSVAAVIIVTLALVATFALVINQTELWEYRFNSTTTGSAAMMAAEPSRLTGSTRWQVDVDGGESAALTTASGLAVPVAADQDHNAGVIMIDPVTGRIRWRYELRGTETAPELSSTDQGRAIVINFDESDLQDVQIPHRIFTLDAPTGRITAFWPDDVVDTDPPVRFRHVAHGTNSVSAMAVDGRKLWTFKPAQCADPRGAVSTPDVIVVPTRRCDNNADRTADELRGFDVRSGDQLWTRPWGSDSPPEQVVAGQDFEIEADGRTLQRRDLRTGKIDWTADLPCPHSGETSASAHTLYIHSCSADNSRPDVLQSYDLTTGTLLWQRRVTGQVITALAEVDGRRVAALAADTTGKHRSCRVELIGASTARTLLTFPQDTRADNPLAEYRPNLTQCQSSSIQSLAGSVVLQLHLSTPPGGGLDQTRYRFIGLS